MKEDIEEFIFVVQFIQKNFVVCELLTESKQ